MKIFLPGGTTVFIYPPNDTKVGTMTKRCKRLPLRPAYCSALEMLLASKYINLRMSETSEKS